MNVPARLATLAIAAVCVALPASAAAGTLDQQQTDTSLGNASIVKDLTITQSLAQAFTAGSSGALDQVDLLIGRYDTSTEGPLTVEIRNVVVTTGKPDTSVLASASVSAASVPLSGGVVAVPFASPPTVTAGTKYAIVAYTGASNLYLWGRGTGDPYAGGQNFVSSASPPSIWGAPPSDLAFKTYVLTSAYPNESVVANAVAGS
jgi:hypothetical protein